MPEKIVEMPPIVTVTETVASAVPLVWCIRTCWPGSRVAEVRQVVLLSTKISPPATEIGAGSREIVGET